MTDDLISTLGEICKRLKVSRNTCLRLINKKKLPVFQFIPGGTYHLKESSYQLWLKDIEKNLKNMPK